MNRVIYDDENIIGFAQDIIDETKDLMIKAINDNDKDVRETFEVSFDLIDQLESHIGELVVCVYHPMGAYKVYELEAKEMTTEEDYVCVL